MSQTKSIFYSFLKAFFVTIGILVAFLTIFIFIAAFPTEDGFSSSIKIAPDAEGSKKELAKTSPVILEIHLQGVIGKEGLTGEKMRESLFKAREELKDRVKGIFLYVNTPGGGVFDIHSIYEEILEYKKCKNIPVYAYIEGICASGGVYITSLADKIMANEISVIGSVGVVSWPPYFNVTDALNKIGINSKTLLAGKGKDNMNPFRPWREGEEERSQHLIDFFYQDFVEKVAKGRPKLDKQALVEEYGARVFPAPEALEIGFIDECGKNRSLALKSLVAASGIKEDEKYQVVTMKTKTWWKQAIEEDTSLLRGVIRHKIELPFEVHAGSLPFEYRYIP